MSETDAWILPPRNPATAGIRLERRSLCERAIVALRKSGIDRIAISTECRLGAATLRRLARLGIALLTRESAREATAEGRRVVVVSSDVVFEPAAVSALVDRLAAPGARVVAAAEASPGTFAAFSPAAATDLPRASSDRDILDRLDSVRVTSLGGRFCRAIVGRRDAFAVERSYTNHVHRLDGTTKKVARLLLSPFSRVLRRLAAGVSR